MARNMMMAVGFPVFFASLVVVTIVHAAQPELLADPTRPPVGVSAVDVGGVVDVSPSRLTSVMLPKQGGRPSAIIGGEVVPLGGKVGEARLVRVTETSVVLEGPEGVERLYLTPDVEKKMIVTKSAVQRHKDKP